jgi:hypothetical protein
VAALTDTGQVWIVTGMNGENRIEARGATQDEAWHNAVLQTEAMGMAGLDLFRIAESMGCLRQHDPGLAQCFDGLVDRRQIRIPFRVVQWIDVVFPGRILLRQPHDQLLEPCDSAVQVLSVHASPPLVQASLPA